MIHIAWIALLFFSCTTRRKQEKISRVVFFHYGGYGDTSCSTLEGQIFMLSGLEKRDTLKLADVEVKVLEQNRKVLTNKNGQFVLNLGKGIFSLLVSKTGLQPIIVRNYVSDPDQFSAVEIYLEPGSRQQIFIIPGGGTKE